MDEERELKSKESEEFWSLLDRLFSEHTVIIDRPKGSRHPRYPKYVYPFDYGYLEGTSSQDGGGIDVWVGTYSVKKVVGIISSIDYLKKDSEIKILYACTQKDIQKIFQDHNRTENMKGILNMRDEKTALMPEGLA